MTREFYMQPVWDCQVCGNKGPWSLTLRWLDASGCWWVPGGICMWDEERPRVARACSNDCGRQFAKAAGQYRISITRPWKDDEWASLGAPGGPVPAKAGPERVKPRQGQMAGTDDGRNEDPWPVSQSSSGRGAL